MIYSQATGGFGNQLYNYAIGFALAQTYNDELTIDISPYKFSPRPFVLNQLTISGKIESIYPPGKDSKFFRMIARIMRILASNRYGYCKWIKESTETRNQFGNYDFSHGASLYLEGYWQNYRYFDKYYKLLCDEFKLKEEYISAPCQDLIRQVLSQDSVAVHIRRGDYEAAWILNDEYYHKSFEFINETVENPHYYIFCEDVSYVKEHYRYLSSATFVTGKFPLSDLEEFWLMSKCKHQITANSTFSWWAAYLNQNPDKIIVAPEYMHWTKEYYPESWHIFKINN